MAKKKQAAQSVLESIADQTLSLFKRVAELAQRELDASPIQPANILASTNTATFNTFVSGAGARTLDKLDQGSRESYKALVREPAIARVVVSDGDEIKT